MKYFFSFYLLASATLAAYFAVEILTAEDRKYPINRLVAASCMSSALWSLGFGALILQTNPQIAYYCRSIGMIGVFWFLISAQVLVCRISGIGKRLRQYFEGFSWFGIIIYFFVIQPEVTIYKLGDMGMTYYFKKGPSNNLYTAYSVILAVHILFVVFYMIFRSPLQRVRKFGKQFLVVTVLVILGMILDTVFPLMGMEAIPGSSMTQFIGLIIACKAVRAINMSRININNMSRYIYYSLEMPVLVYDTDYRMQIMNDAGHRFFGQMREEDQEVQIPIESLFSCSEKEIFSFQGGSNSLDTVCRYNQVPCSLDISNIYDAYKDIIGYIIIVTDLSERVQAMNNLRIAKREAELANNAKSRFLANMSHEIRTPMNAIVGFSELLLKDELNETARDYVQDIKSSSINLLTIINDILDISKIESGKVDIAEAEYQSVELLNDVGQIIRMQAKDKNLEYHLIVSEDFPSGLYGDQVRIRSVLVNLLNNAVKYTEEGSICLRASVQKRCGEMAELVFAVEDTGIGVSEDELDKLFERFSRADIKRNYYVEGTGLGLSIVKNNVAIMGGQITVDSTYGQGSTFTVTIPQRVTDERPYELSVLELENQNAGKTENVAFHDVRVLVVDDNPVNLKVACKSLESYGLTVDAVASGSEAIECCKNERYPLIFMDQMMLPMDGVEAMKQIRALDAYYEKGGAGKILVLTANAIIGVKEELLAEGFDAYLEKPMNFAAMEKALLAFLPEEKRGRAAVGVQDGVCAEDADHAAEDLDMDRSTDLREQLSNVNLEKGISLCGGTVDDYLEILATLYESGESQLAKLQDAYQRTDSKAYAVLVHALKGGLLNIGADTQGAHAKALEFAAKADDWAYVEENHDAFCQEYATFLESVGKVLAAQRGDPATEIPEAGSDKRRLLAQVRSCVAEFDYAGASAAMQKLAQFAWEDAQQEKIAQLTQQLAELEDERVIALVDEMLAE